MPQVVAPPAEVHNVTVVKKVSLDVAPVMDPRDAKIASLEAALQSFQSALEKVQSTDTALSNKQHSNSPVKRPLPQKAAVMEMSGEAALLPAERNRYVGQMAAYCHEYDAPMCSFIFRMQQHNFESHQFAQQRAMENYQFAQQRTIERLELENFLHSRR